jgi:hypothetical protein
MRKHILTIAAVITSFSLFNGCSKFKATNTFSLPLSAKYKIENTIDPAKRYFSPFTGEEVSNSLASNTPFMVIIENSKAARPQSGLSEADIVFETMAEGGIPRFIALFQKNSPKEIGPVRSARPYFIDISKEYALPFGHCGGSEEALICIKSERLMSMDEMFNSSYYWRDKSRHAPHNLYTSAANIRKLVATKGFVSNSSFGHKFDSQYWKNTSFPNANRVVINVNRYYTVEYELKNNEYLKTMDKIPTIDRTNNNQLSVANVVVQITDIKLKEDGSHVDVDLISSGSGYIISNGKYSKVNWNRKDIDSPTIFTDASGREVPLSPGKTWWHITDKNLNIQFK